jgi:hypothetical protein
VIFVQHIEEELKEFFGVLLLVYAPLAAKVAAHSSESRWPEVVHITLVHVRDQGSVSLWQDAFGSFPIIPL